MPLVTVLIPTYNHEDLLLRSMESVRRQSVQDYELFVVGDGVPDRTRTIMQTARRMDSRIRFFDNPKGARTGEIYRHAALGEARGQYVCYLGDDDLWLPHHLHTLLIHLEKYDFAHTIQIDIKDDGEPWPVPCDLGHSAGRQKMLNQRFNMFGLSVVGHRLDFYRKLPFGWRTAPEDIWTDLHMWRQCLSMPECRYKTIFSSTSLKFPERYRADWSFEQRGEELDSWLEKMMKPGFLQWWDQQVSQILGTQFFALYLDARNLRASLESYLTTANVTPPND